MEHLGLPLGVVNGLTNVPTDIQSAIGFARTATVVDSDEANIPGLAEYLDEGQEGDMLVLGWEATSVASVGRAGGHSHGCSGCVGLVNAGWNPGSCRGVGAATRGLGPRCDTTQWQGQARRHERGCAGNRGRCRGQRPRPCHRRLHRDLRGSVRPAVAGPRVRRSAAGSGRGVPAGAQHPSRLLVSPQRSGHDVRPVLTPLAAEPGPTRG